MKKYLPLFYILVSLSVWTPLALALDKGFSSSNFRPASDNGDYFGIWSSQNLYQLEWRTGTLLTYEYHPLQTTQNNDRAAGITDNSFIQHFYGSFGLINKWLSIGLDLPVGWLVDFKNPNVAGSTFDQKQLLGDLRINLKSQLYHSNNDQFGIALVPFIDLPTGSGKYFFGNGIVSGGSLIVFEFKPVNRFEFSFNTGVSGRSTFNFRDIERTNQLLLGFGANYKISDHVALAAEINSQTRLSGIYKEKAESPTEVIGGTKWAVGYSGVTVNVGGGVGIVHGGTSPIARAFAGISYTPFRKNLHKLTEALQTTVVHFDSDKSEIKPAEKEKLARLVPLLKKTYSTPVSITGYTDSQGTIAKNKTLSISRAEALKNYLIALKIKAERFFTSGEGIADPVGDNDTQNGRALNRRAEFAIPQNH